MSGVHLALITSRFELRSAVYRPRTKAVVYRRRRDRRVACADGDLIEVVANAAQSINSRPGGSQPLVDDDLSRVVAARANVAREVGAHVTPERRIECVEAI